MENSSEMFADACALFASALNALLPQDAVPVDVYAAGHRYVMSPGYTGRWSNAVAPALCEPMASLTDPIYDTTAIVGPARSGKTSVGENWFLELVATAPGNLLWYLPTDALRDSYVKTVIDPMIAAHPELSDRLGRAAVDDSLKFKRFDRMTVEFLAAAYNNLLNKNPKHIIGDEIDAWTQLANAREQLEQRRNAAGEGSHMLVVSHPDRGTGLDPDKDWRAGIMDFYRDSTRCVRYWPCPRCGGWSSPAPTALRHIQLTWEGGDDAPLDVVEATAHLKCPLCLGRIEDGERAAMETAALWVGLGQEIDRDGHVTGTRVQRRIAGYWLLGVMSPFLRRGLGGLARSVANADRVVAMKGDHDAAREVYAKGLGVPYRRKTDTQTVDARALAERCDPYPLRKIPQGCTTLIAATDVQKTYFDNLVRGFNATGESWVIDRFRVERTPTGEEINPASYPEHWDLLVQRVLRRSYPLDDDTGRRMMIRAWGYDISGVPGVTKQAREAWVRWHAKGVVRRFLPGPYGERYNVMPTKGMPSKSVKLQIAFPDGRHREERPTAWWGAPLVEFSSSGGKDALWAELNRAKPGPGYVHFSRELLDPNGPPHPFFEELTAERPNDEGVWEKVDGADRNEALDLMVMAGTLAAAWGIDFAQADCPPDWLRPWDSNPLVVRMSEDGEVADIPAANAVRPPARRMLSRGLR